MKQKHLLARYTGLFAVACLLLCAVDLAYGRSLLYAGAEQAGDGLLQHFNALSYYGQWLRTLLHNLLVEHRLAVPLWDLSIGLGGDVITTLSYYVLGDPLCLLAVFVPADQTELLYNALVVLRLYLAGLAFLGYARHRGCTAFGALVGSLVYAFSFYTTVVAVLHPYYLNPLIYLPLLLWGIDNLLAGKSRAGFVLAVFLAAVSNFYFFYMLTLVMAVYAVLALWQKYRAAAPGWGRSLGRDLWQGAACYLLGLSMAAFLFLPSAAAVLSGNRVGGGASVPLAYEPLYYAKLIIAFVNASADYYSALGYTTIGLLAVGLLFATPLRRHGLLKLAFLLGAAGLCIPFVGHAMNGFGYVVNRWVWAFCFVVAYIVARMMPRLVELRLRWLAAAAAGVVVFALPTFYFRAQGDGAKIRAAFLVCGMAAVVLALVVLAAWRLCRAGHSQAAVQAGLVLCLVLGNQFLNTFGFYAPCSGNDVANHGQAGAAWQQLHQGPVSAVAALPDISTVRFDTAGFGFAGVRPNAAMQYDVNGTAFYYSVANPATAAFLAENEVNVYTDYLYSDLDGRAWVDAQLGVRYLVVPSGNEAVRPWGYDIPVADDGTYAVYTSDNTLPLAYFYDAFYDGAAYEELTMPRKQQAALQAAAVDEAALAATGVAVPRAEVQWWDADSGCTLTAEEGITVSGNTITVTDPQAALHLHTEAAAENCERYLVWDNLWFQGKDFTPITVSDDTHTMQMMVASTNAARYAGIHDIAINLGSRTDARDFTVRFGKAGTYTVDALRVVSQPMEPLAALTQARRAVPVNYALQGDEVTLTVENPTAGLVYLAVPYSAGWSARVDGNAATVLQANGFGMAVALPAGSHQIRLHYTTPLLPAGAAISVVGWALFLLTFAVRRTGVRSCKKTKNVAVIRFGRNEKVIE